MEEGSARRRDPYLKTHNTHTRQAYMPQVEFETTIPANERPLTHTLDRVATGIGRPISGNRITRQQTYLTYWSAIVSTLNFMV